MKISIVGTVGLPANYGGFETLVENLVAHHDKHGPPVSITVYCSGKSYSVRQASYLSAKLRYIPLHANGAQSVLYDLMSIIWSVKNRSDIILLLGVSGAIALPFVRLFSSARVITNVDGIEWRRDKWKGLAKRFLKLSEQLAMRWSHSVIADNEAIAQYVRSTYNVSTEVIAYGGDHALSVAESDISEYSLPENFAFGVCRIEPENNLHLILEAFAQNPSANLVMVGNWDKSVYGKELRERYRGTPNMYLLDPIYDVGALRALRTQAEVYVHGHSAGGTNPSLVEAMQFGLPVLAFDCSFNRETTEGKAIYFRDAADLSSQLRSADRNHWSEVGKHMLEISGRRYKWSTVAEQYFHLFLKDA